MQEMEINAFNKTDIENVIAKMSGKNKLHIKRSISGTPSRVYAKRL